MTRGKRNVCLLAILKQVCSSPDLKHWPVHCSQAPVVSLPWYVLLLQDQDDQDECWSRGGVRNHSIGSTKVYLQISEKLYFGISLSNKVFQHSWKLHNCILSDQNILHIQKKPIHLKWSMASRHTSSECAQVSPPKEHLPGGALYPQDSFTSLDPSVKNTAILPRKHSPEWRTRHPSNKSQTTEQQFNQLQLNTEQSQKWEGPALDKQENAGLCYFKHLVWLVFFKTKEKKAKNNIGISTERKHLHKLCIQKRQKKNDWEATACPFYKLICVIHTALEVNLSCSNNYTHSSLSFT